MACHPRKPRLVPIVRAAWACAGALTLPMLVAHAGCHSANDPVTESSDADSQDEAAIIVGTDDDPFAVDASDPERVRLVLHGCQGGPETYCHGRGAGGTYLSLASDGGDLIDVPSSERPELFRVEPFAPSKSYLILKLRGDGGIEGGRMPLGGPYDRRIAPLFETWIEAGAR